MPARRTSPQRGDDEKGGCRCRGGSRPCGVVRRVVLWGGPALLAGLILAGASGRAPTRASAGSVGQAAPVPGPDYALRVSSESGGRVTFAARRAGPAALLVSGLSRGGAVTIAVNGERPRSVELLATGAGAQGRADSALVGAVLKAGVNEVSVLESDGVQVVRVSGTNRWFAAATALPAGPVFEVDLDNMPRQYREYPVRVNYGPRGEGFLWFSAKWDKYYGEVYVERVTRVSGTSGPDAAELAFVLEDSTRHLVMPTRLTVLPDPATGACTIRVYQALRATGPTTLGDGTQFLHVKLTDQGAQDWADGTVDYAWYRSQTGACDDAPPGSHTGMVRVDDNTLRVYAYRSSSADPLRTTLSSTHHTGAGVNLGARNTIGGYFSRSGVGSCGWVFHFYRANFRDDLNPVFGHCGDGADTHFFASAFDFYYPLALRAGDLLETEYSLSLLPSEVTREEIEDLNEADLHFFGTEAEQTASITGWIGTKHAIGLSRSDGSVILLGLGREPGVVPVPRETVRRAISAYQLFGLVEPAIQHVGVGGGTVAVRPGWVTVVDCGAALWEPVPGGDGAAGPPAAEAGAVTEDAAAAAALWLQAVGGGPVTGSLRRK